MDKKGEMWTLAFLLFVLATSIVIYGFKVENKNYVGDISAKVVYNISAINPECNFQKIKIDRENIKLFSNLIEAESEGFKLNETCS